MTSIAPHRTRFCLIASTVALLFVGISPAHALFCQHFLFVRIDPNPQPAWIWNQLPTAYRVASLPSPIIPAFHPPATSSFTDQPLISPDETTLLLSDDFIIREENISFLPESTFTPPPVSLPNP